MLGLLTRHTMDSIDFAQSRTDMVDQQIVGRGVYARRVLQAMRAVPREQFVPSVMREFAYDDVPLSIAPGQLLPRPGAVAVMLAALDVQANDKVLEIGTGTGYVTALLSRLAHAVCSVEPEERPAAAAAATLRSLACGNVQVRHALALAGWPEQAPFDAILVHGSARELPAALRQQLAVGGRLVATLGADPAVGELVRIIRMPGDAFQVVDVADVAADPPLGDQAAVPAHPGAVWARMRTHRGGAAAAADQALAQAIAAVGERFATAATADLEPLLKRIGDARVVLLGEATHGSADFYRMRDRITRDLIVHQGFSVVAIEADWPDAARIDRHVRGRRPTAAAWSAFARFPTWMWRNQEVRSFVDWLRQHNAQASRQVAFHGLDLYSMHNAIHAVLAYLEAVDPASARVARQRYGCLMPWQSDPASYGLAALTPRYESCEQQVVQMLVDLHRNGPLYAAHDGERLFDAEQNARVVSHAERYYRTMYYGARGLESARQPHVRHAQAVAGVPWCGLQGGGLGAQLACWRFGRHRDVAARRIQPRPPLSRRVRAGRLSGWLRYRQRHRGGSVRLGRADGDHGRASGLAGQL